MGTVRNFREIMAQPFKIFRGKPRVSLPMVPDKLPKTSLSFDEIILKRKSDRTFKGPVSLDKLAKILYYGYGTTRILQTSEENPLELRLRTVPSAGALYPLELYIFSLNISGLTPGLYHYNIRDNYLEFLREDDYLNLLINATFSKEIIQGAAGIIALTAVFSRTKFKYRKQSYRFILLEAGHVSQNMMLTATSLNLGTVAIGGFIDNEINNALDIDGVNEATLYLLAFGNPK